MNENTSTPAATPAPKNNRSTIIIGLLLVIILIQGVKWYLDSQEIKEKDEKIETTEQELASTKQRMIEIKNELEQKISEVQKLGGDVTDLQTAKAEIETELKRTTRANGKVIKDLKDKVEGYELLLKNKDEEIEKLKNVNKELLTENKTLKTEKNQLGDSLNQLSQTKEELATKVAIASQLKVENIKIVAVNERGKERESPFKNKQVNKLKVDFNIAENNVAPIEGKKILIRVIDENGQVIFDVARGSGTFMYGGKEEFYTAAQEILFDNTKQKLTFLYEKGSDYASGTYTLEIYTDDYQMGSGQFTVK
jgi:cell division protein ZapB